MTWEDMLKRKAKKDSSKGFKEAVAEAKDDVRSDENTLKSEEFQRRMAA